MIWFATKDLRLIAAALRVTLETDQTLGILEAEGAVTYQAMTGATRQEIKELLDRVEAFTEAHGQ